MKNKHYKILIVDDEQAARYGISRALARPEYKLEEAVNGRDALNQLAVFNPDLVLCDVYMPEMDGLEFLRTIQLMPGSTGNVPLVIILTAFGSEKIAVEAMKTGAYDYISKPFEIDELRLVVNKALEKIDLERENIFLKQQLGQQSSLRIIGNSPPLQNILRLIDKVAPADVTLLLTGESGTGKELVANTVHSQSPRADQPFVTMNCAAIPKDLVESELFGHERGAFTGATQMRQGKFEIANKGTLFLDEIADMGLETQAKILRILEDKSFMRLGGKQIIQTDVRLISATNKDLIQEIEQGRFREDLYYRLKVVEIKLPALKDRNSDIQLLTRHFINIYSQKHQKNIESIEPGALHVLQSYSWPGNVRQLMHVIEQCVVLADGHVITLNLLPAEITGTVRNVKIHLPADELSFTAAKEKMVTEFETEFISKALSVCKGNVTQAAKMLQMKRQFLQQKMKSLGIESGQFRA